MPQTPETISAASGSKFTILLAHVEEILLLNKFFFRLSIHAARWKCRSQKRSQKSPSGQHRTTLSGYIFATKACIDNRKKKLVKQQYLLHMSPEYGELRHTSGRDRFGSLGHPSYFQRLPRLGSVTARQSSSERQPNFAALTRGRRLCFVLFLSFSPYGIGQTIIF